MQTPAQLGLPHRPPFVFLTRILAIEPGVSGIAEHCFDPADPVFSGHFPGNPLVPGVLLAESIAQLGGIIAGAASPGHTFLLAAIRSMKFPGSATPGETLTIQARCDGDMGGLLQFSGTVQVGEKTVASGTIVLAGA